MIKKIHPKDRLRQLFQDKGVVRLSEISKAGIHSQYVHRLCESGEIVKSSRGIYSSANFDFTEHHSIAEACQRATSGVICLMSALFFHGLTTQIPGKICVAIGIKNHKPQISYPPVSIFRFSRTCLKEGVEEHIVEGVQIRVTNPARTVVDCFKYRHKIGLDVAIEALHDVFREGRATYDEILHFAKLCRMKNIITPYLETIAWKQSEH